LLSRTSEHEADAIAFEHDSIADGVQPLLLSARVLATPMPVRLAHVVTSGHVRST